MRIGIATFSALAVVAFGSAIVPAEAAAPAPVASISVAPRIDNQGSASVTVSWSGADPSADGVVVCVNRGTSVPATPDSCESHVAVSPPYTSSGPLPIFPAKTYVVAVYDYVGTTPQPTYSSPVSQVRHGTKLSFQYACPSYAAGTHCTISTVLRDVYRGVALANRQVELWTAATRKGASWSRVARTVTNAAGRAATTITLTKSTLYQWRYPGATSHQLVTYSARYNLTTA